jgi:hypothetical protein
VEEALELWSYRRNGAVEGPVSKEELKTLFEAGKITRQTLVRSSLVGGGWRRYKEIADRRSIAASHLPRSVKNLWPWFVLGTPVALGLLDVYVMQSEGNALIEENPWLGHAPFALSILVILLWLGLIWNEVGKSEDNRAASMVLWVVIAPVYQSFSWWATALVISLINASFGFGLPSCQSDIARALVLNQFEKSAAKKGEALTASFGDTRQQWVTERIRMCGGKLMTEKGQTFTVRYKIEDRGNNLFRNTLHGLSVTMLVE